MIAYFVSFVAEGGNFGSVDITLARPVLSMADIRVMQDLIRDAGWGNNVILSWRRFEDEA